MFHLILVAGLLDQPPANLDIPPSGVAVCSSIKDLRALNGLTSAAKAAGVKTLSDFVIWGNQKQGVDCQFLKGDSTINNLGIVVGEPPIAKTAGKTEYVYEIRITSGEDPSKPYYMVGFEPSL